MQILSRIWWLTWSKAYDVSLNAWHPMSQGLSVQVFYADYVIQVTTYLLWFSIQCFLTVLFFTTDFCIFFILISVVPFFPVLFQILTSVISFILLLHLPVPSTVFLVAFIFDKYFSLRLSALWFVHAPGWSG